MVFEQQIKYTVNWLLFNKYFIFANIREFDPSQIQHT